MKKFILFSFLASCSCFAQDLVDTTTPFEKVVILRKKDGDTESRAVRRIKKTPEGYELEKAEGGVALFPASEIIAVIPQYPKKGIKYTAEDIKMALQILRSLPRELAPPESDLKKWEMTEEILASSKTEVAVEPEKSSETKKTKTDASEESSSPATAGTNLKTVMSAEELYEACSGPLGKSFVGKTVIIDGQVDGVESWAPIDGFTKPKKIYMVGKSKPTGGNYQVRCEVRGPIIFLYEDGNLFARYIKIEPDGKGGKKYLYYTTNDDLIENPSDRINTQIEFPLVNKGSRLLIAQKIKVVGFTRMGDLDLVGANVEKEPISWGEIESLSEKARHRGMNSSESGGMSGFKKIFIEVDQ